MNNRIRSFIVRKLNDNYTRNNTCKEKLEQTKELLKREDIKDDDELFSLVQDIFNIIKNNYCKEH